MSENESVPLDPASTSDAVAETEPEETEAVEAEGETETEAAPEKPEYVVSLEKRLQKEEQKRSNAERQHRKDMAELKELLKSSKSAAETPAKSSRIAKIKARLASDEGQLMDAMTRETLTDLVAEYEEGQSATSDETARELALSRQQRVHDEFFEDYPASYKKEFNAESKRIAGEAAEEMDLRGAALEHYVQGYMNKWFKDYVSAKASDKPTASSKPSSGGSKRVIPAGARGAQPKVDEQARVDAGLVNLLG